MFFHLQECLKFVKNVHFSQSEDFTSKYFHPSDPLSDLHLDATALLLKVSYDPLFGYSIASYLLGLIFLTCIAGFESS